jgi:hypothetical protein
MVCDSTTPLPGWFMLSATWSDVREHAAGPPDYWGSRGRGFESRRPDIDKALTSGNAVRALTSIDGDLNPHPNTTLKGAARCPDYLLASVPAVEAGPLQGRDLTGTPVLR